MIDISVLRGYVLEELLAALLKSSGYDLLVDAKQDHAALTGSGQTLRVRGRGANHQVDVLGQLRARVEFVHPVRLFLEAKCRGSKSGLTDVRNALGVLNDVNEHYSWATAQASSHPYKRFHYRYALFSTSGFSEEAQRYAITQQITLVDLSAPRLGWLRDLADRIATTLLALATDAGLKTFPVSQMREALRRALKTWTVEEPVSTATASTPYTRALATARPDGEALSSPSLARIAAEAHEDLDGVLYLGWTTSPYVLVFYSETPELAAEFLVSVRGAQPMPATLTLRGRTPETSEFVLTPRDAEPGVADLHLTLPGELEEEVLAGVEVGSRTIRLLLPDAIETAVSFEPVRDLGFPGADWEDRRYDIWRETHDAEPVEVAEHVEWTPEAFAELLERLRAEGWWAQADVIEFAAGHDGWVSRAVVYQIAEYPLERTLRGFTRPPRRITRLLVAEGLVDHEAWWPLQTRYEAGVQATHFVVPPEFSAFIDG